MIGLLELLAVLSVISTWYCKGKSADWHAYIDNDGVLSATINAASRAADANQSVGLLLEETSRHVNQPHSLPRRE